MNEEQREKLFDLLTKKAVYGLDDAEQVELDELDPGTGDAEFHSLEITAAAISMVGLSTEEPLPAHLYSKIAADAAGFVGAGSVAEAESPWPPATDRYADTREPSQRASSWFGWLGWMAAAAACVALALNVWVTQRQPDDRAGKLPPTEVDRVQTPDELREAMLTTPGAVKASWAPGNVKEIKQINGDIVWSDQKQAGYMRFRGLPVNDATATCYQLWIFDKTQDPKKPIDGGTFDIPANGEIVIPINAKLKAEGAYMFAITIERRGGVVVSDREKLVALAKVETQAS